MIIITIILIITLLSINFIQDREINYLYEDLAVTEVHRDNLIERIKIHEDMLKDHQELQKVSSEQITLLKQINTNLETENKELAKLKTPSRASTTPRTSSGNLGEFTVTAYDLSVQSCGKAKDHPQYGITASGESLVGHTWESAKAIATDPKVIPLGSKVEVTFIDENYSKYDGIYTSKDTGSAIKGNKIDLFYGEDVTVSETMKFGTPKATIRILE